MKQSTLLVFAVSAALLGLMASSQGVAEAQNRDRTGAPGSDPICTSCHSGYATASASFEVVDAATQEAATAYTPGQEYLVRMVFTGGNATSVYGMQSTVVLSDGSNAGTFSAPSGNAQLEEVDGRHIVEHNAASASNVFEVTWTAPAAGSGNADFYMSALECNGNGLPPETATFLRPCPCRKWLTLQASTAWPQLPLQIGPALCPLDKCGLGPPLKQGASS